MIEMEDEVRVDVYEMEGDLYMTFIDFIELWDKTKKEIPEEYLDKAVVEIGGSTQGSFGDVWTTGLIEIYYYRPENDDEKLTRELSYNRQTEAKIEGERQEYLRLKEKFEGKS